MASIPNGGVSVPGNLVVMGDLEVHGDSAMSGDASVSGSIAVASVAYIQLTPSASAPEGAGEGAIYMDTDHKLYVHNGTDWKEVSFVT